MAAILASYSHCLVRHGSINCARVKCTILIDKPVKTIYKKHAEKNNKAGFVYFATLRSSLTKKFLLTGNFLAEIVLRDVCHGAESRSERTEVWTKTHDMQLRLLVGISNEPKPKCETPCQKLNIKD